LVLGFWGFGDKTLPQPTNQHFDVRVELGCEVGWEKEVIRYGLRSEVRSLVRSKKRSGMQKRG